MSLGHQNSSGDKNLNYQFQYNTVALLKVIADALVALGPGANYELLTITYKATANGAGYSIGDIISRTDIIRVSDGAVISTVWFNQTTGQVIAPVPIADLTPYSPPGNVTVTNPFNLEATQLVVAARLFSGGVSAADWLVDIDSKLNSVIQVLQAPLTAGGITTVVSSTVTMSVAGAYSTGDYMGTSTTPQSFANAVSATSLTGIVKSIFISDKITTTNVAMELWLFSATFTAPTDNAAWAISDAEALSVLGVIPISTANWAASANNQIYFDGSLSIPIKLPATSLFYALVARGTTPSFTSGDLTIGLGILKDA